MPDGFFSVCVSLYSSPITVTVLQNKDFDHRPSDFWQPQSKHQSANPAASAAAGIWISFQSLLKPSRCIMQYFNRKSNEKSIKFYENFLWKPGEFVHFWNKIFKPSEEKEKVKRQEKRAAGKPWKWQMRARKRQKNICSWILCEVEIFGWILKIMWYNAIEKLYGEILPGRVSWAVR